jgi:hypothetical protein
LACRVRLKRVGDLLKILSGSDPLAAARTLLRALSGLIVPTSAVMEWCIGSFGVFEH